MLHKKGKRFPALGSAITERDFAESIAAALRIEFGNASNAASTIMRWTGANERAAKYWLAGSHGPNGTNLLLLARQSAPVRRCMLRWSGLPQPALAESLVGLRKALVAAVTEIDAVNDGEKREAIFLCLAGWRDGCAGALAGRATRSRRCASLRAASSPAGVGL